MWESNPKGQQFINQVDVRFGSLADKPSRPKIQLYPLLSESGQQFAPPNPPANRPAEAAGNPLTGIRLTYETSYLPLFVSFVSRAGIGIALAQELGPHLKSGRGSVRLTNAGGIRPC